ncbi:MAG: hypothetical protein IJW83_02515, partial [Clostridia bacterium]|nr:hypothetical protein [Clostridia bacterium]
VSENFTVTIGQIRQKQRKSTYDRRFFIVHHKCFSAILLNLRLRTSAKHHSCRFIARETNLRCLRRLGDLNVSLLFFKSLYFLPY